MAVNKKKVLNDNGSDCLFGTPGDLHDRRMVARFHKKKAYVLPAYVTEVRNYLKLRESLEEVCARLNKERKEPKGEVQGGHENRREDKKRKREKSKEA
jgi:hypothetical protein